MLSIKKNLYSFLLGTVYLLANGGRVLSVFRKGERSHLRI